jgi:hypothetical protein
MGVWTNAVFEILRGRALPCCSFEDIGVGAFDLKFSRVCLHPGPTRVSGRDAAFCFVSTRSFGKHGGVRSMVINRFMPVMSGG